MRILWKGAGHARVNQIGGIVVAAIAFAGSTGTAIYIGLVFAASLAVFGLVALFERWWDDVFAIAISGTLAAVFATPYLLRWLSREERKQDQARVAGIKS